MPSPRSPLSVTLFRSRTSDHPPPIPPNYLTPCLYGICISCIVYEEGALEVMLTPTQMRLAAKFCDERKFGMNADTTPDEMEAGAFLFDNGVFYGGPHLCDEVAKMLREKADELEPVK